MRAGSVSAQDQFPAATPLAGGLSTHLTSLQAPRPVPRPISVQPLAV